MGRVVLWVCKFEIQNSTNLHFQNGWVVGLLVCGFGFQFRVRVCGFVQNSQETTSFHFLDAKIVQWLTLFVQSFALSTRGVQFNANNEYPSPTKPQGHSESGGLLNRNEARAVKPTNPHTHKQ